MKHNIVKIDEDNYSLFEDMVHWRMNEAERTPSKEPVSQDILKELRDPNLYIYAVEAEGKYVGWISLIYMPKVGRFQGHGHVYVDELWVEPSYRSNGFAYELMKMAEMVKAERDAMGIRLYVNTENPSAQRLYEKCGYSICCAAYFMEK